MRQMFLVQGRTPAEFVRSYNAAIERLSGCEIMSEKFISNTSMYLFYDGETSPYDEIEELRQRAEAAYEESEFERFVDVAEGDQALQVDTFEIRIKAGIPLDRRCCDCNNYDWGRGCPYHKGHINHLDPACGMFNVLIERR